MSLRGRLLRQQVRQPERNGGKQREQCEQQQVGSDERGDAAIDGAHRDIRGDRVQEKDDDAHWRVDQGELNLD